MKRSNLFRFLLALFLTLQLNICSAEKNYDEEITLPLGTNFDLEMEEVTRYEYDGNYVKAQTVNGKEQFILQKVGDTIINIVMEENGQKSELRVLVHIVTEEQFNKPTEKAPAKPADNTKKPVEPKAPAATQKPAEPQAPAKKPAATKTPTPSQKQTEPKAPAATQKPAESKADKESAPVGVPRPAAPTRPLNSLEAIKYKADQNAYDVLELINSEREKHGRSRLVMAADLSKEALTRAKELKTRFSHVRPDGSRYMTVMSKPGKIQAESIAAGYDTPSAVAASWLRSGADRDALLNPSFKELGVGYFESSSGDYHTYWALLLRG